LSLYTALRSIPKKQALDVGEWSGPRRCRFTPWETEKFVHVLYLNNSAVTESEIFELE